MKYLILILTSVSFAVITCLLIANANIANSTIQLPYQAPKYDGTFPVVSVSFDHGFYSQINPMLYMANDNFSGGIWVVTNRTIYQNPNLFPWYVLSKFYNMGWSLDSHSQHHKIENSLLPNSTLYSEVVDSKQDLELHDFTICGFVPPGNISYPYSQYLIGHNYNYSTFEAVFQNTPGDIAYYKHIYGIPWLRIMSVGDTDPHNLGYLQNFTIIKQQIDYATSHKNWLIIHFHDIINGTYPTYYNFQYPTQFSTYKQTIDYLKQQSDSGLLRVETEPQALGMTHC